MSYITTRNNTKLYVKDWGTGRPVILMHGWPLSADSWDDQAMPIAKAGFRTIAYDRRGFGRSDQPWEGYNYDTLADDLADVMQETGAKDATIVGFRWVAAKWLVTCRGMAVRTYSRQSSFPRSCLTCSKRLTIPMACRRKSSTKWPRA
jgi:pimeloyl-ACP methyl ester carboxylesterase